MDVNGFRKEETIFTVNAGKTVTISGLSFQDGWTSIFNSGTVTVSNCIFRFNYFRNDGAATVTNCFFSRADIFNNGSLTAANSTMAFAGFSGIENRGTATVTNCTIVDNPDGIKNVSGTTTVRNSIVAGNTTNTVGAVSNGGNNILTGTAAAAGLQGNGNNGGQTNTFALVPGSPAIDAGNNAFIPSGITTDQRGSGFPRILYNTVDIGAFEFGVQIGPNVTVITTDDHDDGRCDTLDCSLREAINVANSDANASVIGFSSLFINSAQTISLGSALPHITTNTTIIGPGADLLKVRQSGSAQSFNIFTVESGANATFRYLAISNGDYGILSEGGTTTVTNCTLSGNRTGIVNAATLKVSNSTLSGNAFGLGNLGTATLTNCTVSGNANDGISNGFGNAGTLTATQCTISGNGISGLLNVNIATVTNCTFSGNNTGISNYGGTTTVKNSLVAGNTTNTAGTITNGGNSILTGTAAAARLDPSGLQDNGGLTKTIALVSGSPAINAGSNALVPSGITTDQRGTGFTRFRGIVDIGAMNLARCKAG